MGVYELTIIGCKNYMVDMLSGDHCKLISLECFTPGRGKIVARRNVNNYVIK